MNGAGFRDLIEVKSNLHIIGRERGKKVPGLCRDGHNVFVNYGREYLTQVIAPSGGFLGHVNDNVVRYMALGIGGDEQNTSLATIAPAVNTDYPGQNTYDANDLTIPYLERPVKISGTAGMAATAGTWLKDVVAPPTFVGSPATTVEFQALFADGDLHLSGAYPNVPVSEVGLFLSNELDSQLWNEVYDAGSGPDFINIATRQKLIAYHPFAPIQKTNTVSMELHWQLQF